MLMSKGFKINNKHTLFDFGAKLKTRTISLPAEKQITNSVPYMNGNYNFSRILGKACYENRELTYVFLFVSTTTTKVPLSTCAKAVSLFINTS